MAGIFEYAVEVSLKGADFEGNLAKMLQQLDELTKKSSDLGKVAEGAARPGRAVTASAKRANQVVLKGLAKSVEINARFLQGITDVNDALDIQSAEVRELIGENKDLVDTFIGTADESKVTLSTVRLLKEEMEGIEKALNDARSRQGELNKEQNKSLDQENELVEMMQREESLQKRLVAAQLTLNSAELEHTRLVNQVNRALQRGTEVIKESRQNQEKSIGVLDDMVDEALRLRNALHSDVITVADFNKQMANLEGKAVATFRNMGATVDDFRDAVDVAGEDIDSFLKEKIVASFEATRRQAEQTRQSLGRLVDVEGQPVTTGGEADLVGFQRVQEVEDSLKQAFKEPQKAFDQLEKNAKQFEKALENIETRKIVNTGQLKKADALFDELTEQVRVLERADLSMNAEFMSQQLDESRKRMKQLTDDAQELARLEGEGRATKSQVLAIDGKIRNEVADQLELMKQIRKQLTVSRQISKEEKDTQEKINAELRRTRTFRKDIAKVRIRERNLEGETIRLMDQFIAKGELISAQEAARLKKLKGANNEFGAGVNAMGDLLKKGLKFGVAYRLIVDVFRAGIEALKNTVRVMVEMDRIAGQIAKVAPALFLGEGGAENLNKVLREGIEISRRYGTELESTTEAMTLFFQQGLTATEAIARTDAAMRLATVTGLQLGESVEVVTAVMRVFAAELENPIRLVDALSKVEQNQAVTAREVSRALLQAGSTAQQLGLSFEDLTGITAAVATATRQTGKEIGTAFRFILPRLTSIEAIKVLNKESIGLFKTMDDGSVDLRRASDVLDDLAIRWDGLSTAVQANIAASVAGRRRMNSFLALMNNFPLQIKASIQALTSLGNSFESIDAIVGRTDKSIVNMQNAFKSFAFEFGQLGLQQLLNDFIKTVTKIIDFITPGSIDVATIFEARRESISSELQKDIGKAPDIINKAMTGIILELQKGGSFTDKELKDLRELVDGNFDDLLKVANKNNSKFRDEFIEAGNELRVAIGTGMAGNIEKANKRVVLAARRISVEELRKSIDTRADAVMQASQNFFQSLFGSDEFDDVRDRVAGMNNELTALMEQFGIDFIGEIKKARKLSDEEISKFFVFTDETRTEVNQLQTAIALFEIYGDVLDDVNFKQESTLGNLIATMADVAKSIPDPEIQRLGRALSNGIISLRDFQDFVKLNEDALKRMSDAAIIAGDFIGAGLGKVDTETAILLNRVALVNTEFERQIKTMKDTKQPFDDVELKLKTLRTLYLDLEKQRREVTPQDLQASVIKQLEDAGAIVGDLDETFANFAPSVQKVGQEMRELLASMTPDEAQAFTDAITENNKSFDEILEDLPRLRRQFSLQEKETEQLEKALEQLRKEYEGSERAAELLAKAQEVVAKMIGETISQRTISAFKELSAEMTILKKLESERLKTLRTLGVEGSRLVKEQVAGQRTLLKAEIKSLEAAKDKEAFAGQEEKLKNMVLEKELQLDILNATSDITVANAALSEVVKLQNDRFKSFRQNAESQISVMQKLGAEETDVIAARRIMVDVLIAEASQNEELNKKLLKQLRTEKEQLAIELQLAEAKKKVSDEIERQNDLLKVNNAFIDTQLKLLEQQGILTGEQVDKLTTEKAQNEVTAALDKLSARVTNVPQIELSGLIMSDDLKLKDTFSAALSEIGSDSGVIQTLADELSKLTSKAGEKIPAVSLAAAFEKAGVEMTDSMRKAINQLSFEDITASVAFINQQSKDMAVVQGILTQLKEKGTALTKEEAAILTEQAQSISDSAVQQEIIAAILAINALRQKDITDEIKAQNKALEEQARVFANNEKKLESQLANAAQALKSQNSLASQSIDFNDKLTQRTKQLRKIDLERSVLSDKRTALEKRINLITNRRNELEAASTKFTGDKKTELEDQVTDLDLQLEALERQTNELDTQQGLLDGRTEKLKESLDLEQKLLQTAQQFSGAIFGGFDKARELSKQREKLEDELRKTRTRGDFEGQKKLQLQLKNLDRRRGQEIQDTIFSGLETSVSGFFQDQQLFEKIFPSDKISAFQQKMIQAAQAFGAELGRQLGGGGPAAGFGGQLGAGLGGLLALTPLGPVGGIIGTQIGGAIGGAIGGMFDEEIKPLEEAIKSNTLAVQANTQTLKEFAEQVINAPARFTSPRGGALSFGGGGGGGITIIVQGAGDPSNTASLIQRQLSRGLAPSLRGNTIILSNNRQQPNNV